MDFSKTLETYRNVGEAKQQREMHLAMLMENRNVSLEHGACYYFTNASGNIWSL